MFPGYSTCHVSYLLSLSFPQPPLPSTAYMTRVRQDFEASEAPSRSSERKCLRVLPAWINSFLCLLSLPKMDPSHVTRNLVCLWLPRIQGSQCRWCLGQGRQSRYPRTCLYSCLHLTFCALMLLTYQTAAEWCVGEGVGGLILL